MSFETLPIPQIEEKENKQTKESRKEQKQERRKRQEETLENFIENFEEYILYEDEDIIVMNKPAGIISHRAPGHLVGIAEVVKKKKGANICHRLDIDTSGLMIFGKHKKATSVVMKQFAQRQVQKRYMALVDGEWNTKIAGIIAPLQENRKRVQVKEKQKGTRGAATSFDEIALLESGGNKKSLLDIRIFTGRKHQIRSHLRHLEYPITGDQLYNVDKLGFERQLLHSTSLTFTHPTTSEEMTLKAPLTDDFKEFLQEADVVEKTDKFDELIK